MCRVCGRRGADIRSAGRMGRIQPELIPHPAETHETFTQRSGRPLSASVARSLGRAGASTRGQGPGLWR